MSCWSYSRQVCFDEYIFGSETVGELGKDADSDSDVSDDEENDQDLNIDTGLVSFEDALGSHFAAPFTALQSRSVIGTKLLYFMDGVGWCTGILMRKAYGEVNDCFKLKMDGDIAQTLQFDDALYHSSDQQAVDGAWCIIRLLQRPPFSLWTKDPC